MQDSPEPRGQLSRESISRAALSLLDDYGLADVSMRRVASSLGVAPGALYWHVENKQALISGLAALIVAPLADAPAPATPTDLCARLRAALLSHRDGAEVVITAVSQPNSDVWVVLSRLMRTAVAAELEAAGLKTSTREHHAAADGLLHLTLGAATVQQSATQLAEATGAAAARSDDVEPAVDFLVEGLKSRCRRRGQSV